MDFLASISSRPGLRSACVIIVGGASFFLASCGSEPPAPPEAAAHPAQVELDVTKLKFGELETSLAAKNEELAQTKAALEAARTQLAERDLVVTQRETQMRTVQAEMDAVKKQDALVFAEISAVQQEGQTVAASIRYQQFVKDYPKSPLVSHASRAITEIAAAAAESAARPRPAPNDPKLREQEFKQQFQDGFLTLKELAPALKNRSVAQVLGLFGPPNRIFGDGTEIGYVDKAIDPVTSKRGMFIIAFDAGVVANLRVEYAGRRMVP